MRLGNDHRLVEFFQLDSVARFRNLPAIVGADHDAYAERTAKLLELLKQSDPTVLPVSAAIAALLEWGVSIQTVARIMEEIGDAQDAKDQSQIKEAS